MSEPRHPECPVPPDRPCNAEVDPERFGYYCEWARRGEPLHLKVIVNRSAMGPGPDTPRPRQASGDKPAG